MLEIKIEKTREYGRQKVQTPIVRRKMLLATSRITVCKTRVPKPISHYQDIFLVSLTEIHDYKNPTTVILGARNPFTRILFFFFILSNENEKYDTIESPSHPSSYGQFAAIQGSLLFIFTSSGRMKFNLSYKNYSFFDGLKKFRSTIVNNQKI